MRSPLVLLAALALPTLLAQTPIAFPSDVIHEANVEYSNVGQRVAMDIVQPTRTTGGPWPAVVMVHGGGFRRGNRESYLPMAIKLAQRDYVAATVSYRLAPRNQFPAAVHDVKAAVRFLRANAAKYNIDPDRIAALGGSAGGHLVLFLGLTAGVSEFEGSGPNREFSSRVQCVVDYYGPTDFTQSYSKSVDAAEVLPLFLGGDLDHNRLAHIRASPLNWVTPDAAPVLALHGTQDTFVAYEQSLWLMERLIAAGVPAELESIPGAGHGFKAADAERADARAFAYLDKMLKEKKQRREILISDHGPAGEIIAMQWPSGKTLWTMPNERGHDVQSLPDGHVLFTIGAKHTVEELDAKHNVVWSYSEGLDHPLAAQRLANGNTLIGDAKLGRVIEITPDKKIVWKYENPDLADMRMRNAHRTSDGTTLIAIEAEGKIVEVDPAGKIVWSWQAPDGAHRKLYQGRRLANGNTVVSLSDPGEIVEVSRDGKVVRSIAGPNLGIQFGWASGFALLPDGGMLVSDYTGRRLVELDKAGKVVNELRTGPRTIASVDIVP
ncbi:MAG: alpha/beta hydrolase fold domain-containing protein [Bryobacteraceae bacterium]